MICYKKIISLKSAMYKFGSLGKKYISPIGTEFALFFSPKRIYLRENSFFQEKADVWLRLQC